MIGRPRIAITRAQPEADATAARVMTRGGEPVLACLLRIEARAFDADLAGVQALLFSSSNGVRAFSSASADRGALVLAVGEATANAARAAGFADVRSADGDVAALAVLARATLAPEAGKLLHISGAHAAGDLAGALTGFQTERRVAYEACTETTLPEAFKAPLDLLLFHSARAAEAFITLGAPRAERLTAICLSPAIAATAAQTRWAGLVVAARPSEAALLDAAFGPKNAPAGANA